MADKFQYTIDRIPGILVRDKSAFNGFISGMLIPRGIANPELLSERIWNYLIVIKDEKELAKLACRIVTVLNNIFVSEHKDNYVRIASINQFINEIDSSFSFQALLNPAGEIYFSPVMMEQIKVGTIGLQISDEDKLVFGAAPEFIKTFINKHEEIPQFVILPRDTFQNGINFAEIEFSIYGNFFMQGGQKVHIISTAEQEHRLRQLLKITLLGPDYEKLFAEVTDPVKKVLYQRLKDFRDLLIARKADGSILHLDDYLFFNNFNAKNRARIELDSGEIITIEQSSTFDDGIFYVYNEVHELLATVDLRNADKEEENYPVRRAPLPHDEFAITVLGSGDGFTPGKPTSSFVAWLEGIPVLFDPWAYSDAYLRRQGLDHNAIHYIYVSHAHGDHDQGVYNYLLKGEKICLIGDELIIDQIMQKIAATIDHTVEETRRIVDVLTLPIGVETKLEGFENIYIILQYGLHSIPSTMCKIYLKDKFGKVISAFGYSGDTLYDPEKYDEWVMQSKLDVDSVDILTHFFQDDKLDLIIHEAGDGLIHTSLYKFWCDHSDKNICWVHTSLEPGDTDKGRILSAGEHVILVPENDNKKLKRYMSLFDKVPLFIGLNATEKLDLVISATTMNGIEIVDYDAGEDIMREGEHPTENYFYIVARGTIDLFQNDKYIVSLGEGQQLGEMALFGNNFGRRNATARALSGVRLIKFEEEIYSKYYDKLKITYDKYSKARDTLNSPESPFRNLDPKIKDIISSRMTEEKYNFKEYLLRKGDTTHIKKLFFVVKGSLGAIIDQKNKIGFRINPGGVVGEMSILENKPPMADVFASDKEIGVVVYSLTRDAFEQLCFDYPGIRDVLELTKKRRDRINKVIERRNTLTQQLNKKTQK